MSDLFIIILNFNGTLDTVDCVESILNSDYKKRIICVVDNGSEKEHLADLLNKITEIEDKFNLSQSIIIKNNYIPESVEFANNQIVVVSNIENLGFAGGNNIAVKIAIKNGYDKVMLLNNDTIVEKDSIKILSDFIDDHPDYVAITPKICYERARDIIWNCGGKIIFGAFRKYYYANKNDSKVPKEGYFDISFITGCALVFKPNETGFLSENFFFGEEDFEFSLRLKKKKMKLACVLNSKIYHKVGSSIKKSNKILNKITLHYINRFTNLHNIYPLVWYCFVFLYILYGTPMLIFKNRISFYRLIVIWFISIRYACNNQHVNKEQFYQIMK